MAVRSKTRSLSFENGSHLVGAEKKREGARKREKSERVRQRARERKREKERDLYPIETEGRGEINTFGVRTYRYTILYKEPK